MTFCEKADMQKMMTVLQFWLFLLVHGSRKRIPKTGERGTLKKDTQIVEKWFLGGSHLGGCWVSFWQLFYMSVLGRKLDTFGYHGVVVKCPHRGAQDGYLTEVKYPKTRIRELETELIL